MYLSTVTKKLYFVTDHHWKKKKSYFMLVIILINPVICYFSDIFLTAFASVELVMCIVSWDLTQRLPKTIQPFLC